MQTWKHSRLVPDSIIQFRQADEVLIDAELNVRLAAYDKLKLPTDMKDGKEDRAERQRLGICGEVAFRHYMGLDPTGIQSGGMKDGGRDAILKRGDLKWSIQVKTWTKDKAGMHLYVPRHIPLKSDVIVGVARKNDDTFRIVGFMMRKDFEDRFVRTKLGKGEYKAVAADDLSPPHALYLMFNGPRAT